MSNATMEHEQTPLTMEQTVRLGLPIAIPPQTARTIACFAAAMRDVDRLEEISGILQNMQVTPAVFAGRRGSYNVDMEGIKIVELLEGVETDILEEPIEMVSYGSRGAKYVKRWRLVGPTSQMQFTGGFPGGGSREIGLCELHDGLGDHMIGAPGTRYHCGACTDNWTGSLPGEIIDHGTLPTGGWFADEISFLQRLVALIQQSNRK